MSDSLPPLICSVQKQNCSWGVHQVLKLVYESFEVVYF